MEIGPLIPSGVTSLPLRVTLPLFTESELVLLLSGLVLIETLAAPEALMETLPPVAVAD